MRKYWLVILITACVFMWLGGTLHANEQDNSKAKKKFFSSAQPQEKVKQAKEIQGSSPDNHPKQESSQPQGETHKESSQPHAEAKKVAQGTPSESKKAETKKEFLQPKNETGKEIQSAKTDKVETASSEVKKESSQPKTEAGKEMKESSQSSSGAGSDGSPHKTEISQEKASPSPATESEQEGQSKDMTRITAIEVSGNQQISSETILGVVRSKVGDPLLEPRIRTDLQAIFELGYFTDVKVDTPYYAGGVKLIYRVQENPVVKKISLLGNKTVPTEKIKELMQTKEGKILNMRILNGDIQEINYYYDEVLGYMLKPTHISSENINWTSQGELILTIQEGMSVKEIQVTGSSLFSQEKLRSMVKMKPGDIFNSKQVKEDSNAISKYYEEEGYILDTVRPQVDYKKGIVTIQIIEAVVEDIRLEFEPEKHKTKDYVVMRNIRTKKNEVLVRDRLQKDIERLNNLGYFSKVNVDPEPGTKPGYLILVFKLKEQKTGLATLGVGYTGGGSGALRSGITGAISYSEKNLGGTGQALSASWQRGVNIDASSLGYSNPAINDNQDSLSLTLFRTNYLELRQSVDSKDRSKYALYDDKRTGGSVTYGRRITDDLRLFFSYRKESLEISKNPKSDYTPTGISKGTLNGIGVGALYDTRNDVFDPTDGMYGDASFTHAGTFLKGDYEYNKYVGEIRKYFPINKKKTATIALRAWGGMVKGKNAPVTETFYVGGTDTIRGYQENEFYGTRMVVLNAEYRFPIAGIKFLKGAVFADAGNAWTPGDGNRKKFYKDAGVGLRIVFPTLGLGVIRLDYASGERGGKTSIGIGQTF